LLFVTTLKQFYKPEKLAFTNSDPRLYHRLLKKWGKGGEQRVTNELIQRVSDEKEQGWYLDMDQGGQWYKGG